MPLPTSARNSRRVEVMIAVLRRGKGENRRRRPRPPAGGRLALKVTFRLSRRARFRKRSVGSGQWLVVSGQYRGAGVRDRESGATATPSACQLELADSLQFPE